MNLRLTHPNLYHSIMVLGIMSIALAVNFWTSNPTFDPWPGKNAVGAIFFLIGTWYFIFTNMWRSLRMVRLGLAFSLFFFAAWGIANMAQSFAGKASFQLPIIYLALAALHYPLVVEPAVNPVTEKSE